AIMSLQLAITPGEPAGIGPDLLIQLVQQPELLPADCHLIAIASPELLLERAKLLGLPLQLQQWQPGQEVPARAGHLGIVPVSLRAPVIPGQLTVDNAHYVLESLRIATKLCQDGHVRAM